MSPVSRFFSDKTIRGVVKAVTARHEAECHQVREAKLLLRDGKIKELSELPYAPSDFENALDYLEYAQVRDLFRKIELPNPLAKAKAEDVFLSCEAQCFESNYFLSRLDDKSELRRLLEMASRHCRRILGKVPDEVHGRHGPGAAFGVSSAASTAADKMQEPPTRTPDSDIFLHHWSLNQWGRQIESRFGTDYRTKIVHGNRFTTVPKDFSKDRGICVEPSLNVYYQLGVGGHIRSRLKRLAGIDLELGQELHRFSARKSSVDGSHATIDLSNASDTVCVEIVRLLLPDDWFELLSSLRSPKTLFKQRWHKLEKFSSMGNGYTFELETLIFLSLILAVCERESVSSETVMVYGDDLIVPSGISNQVITLLKLCGFTPNVKKTFSEGPFRESCGGDFFGGVDVRPHFQKKDPDSAEVLMGFANGLFRVIKKFPSDHPFRRHLSLARIRVIESIPTALRVYGPEALGDILLHDFDWEKFGRTRSSWPSQVWFRVYKPATHKYVNWGHYDPQVVLSCALLRYGDGRRGIMPRRSVTGYKLGWVAYS